MSRWLMTLVVLMAPALAGAAEIALRGEAVVHGSIVRLGDVAEVLAEGDETLDLSDLRQRQLMPAPAPGEVRHLRAPEVLHLLAARGVDVRTLQFSGAESVAIGSPGDGCSGSEPDGMGFQRQPAEADQLADVITQYLREKTGHGRWQVEVAERGAGSALDGARLVVSGGKAPWTGHQRFEVRDASNNPSTISARIERIEMLAFAVRPIERGALIGRSDVELRPHAGASSPQCISTLDAALGKEAAYAIRADSMLLASQLRSPLMVRRGERVSVQARSGGIVVRTYATAQQDGAEGDLITIESLSSKERYAARVTGHRELEVFASRAAASDVAAQPAAVQTLQR